MNAKAVTGAASKPAPAAPPPAVIKTDKKAVDKAVDAHAATLAGGKPSDPATTLAIAGAATNAVKAAKSSKEAPGIISRGNAYRIDPTKIDRKPGWNPRFDMGDIATLALSIEANGVQRDLLVRRAGDRFELIDGDRRLTAVESLLKKGVKFPEGVPAKIAPKGMTDAEAIVLMILANDGKPFLPLEEAAAYKKLRDEKKTIKQICELVGRKPVHVNQMLHLIEADDSVKNALKDKKIGKQQAKDIATKAKGDKGKQKELTEKAVAAKGDKRARRQLNAEVKAITKKKAKKPRTRRMINLSVTHDYFRTLEARSSIKLGAILKDMGYAEGTEVKASTKAEKAMLLCGFSEGVRMAQAHNDEDCHEKVVKLFAKHGIV